MWAAKYFHSIWKYLLENEHVDSTCVYILRLVPDGGNVTSQLTGNLVIQPHVGSKVVVLSDCKKLYTAFWKNVSKIPPWSGEVTGVT